MTSSAQPSVWDWPVAPSLWQSNGNLIFSQTFDTLAMKKNFILNFANNEKKLFFGQASKIAQKSLVEKANMYFNMVFKNTFYAPIIY